MCESVGVCECVRVVCECVCVSVVCACVACACVLCPFRSPFPFACSSSSTSPSTSPPLFLFSDASQSGHLVVQTVASLTALSQEVATIMG